MALIHPDRITDRDSELVAHLFDERNEAVRRMVAQVIRAAHDAGRKIGICGQALISELCTK